MTLAPAEIDSMTKPAWDQAKAAIEDGRPADAVAHIDTTVERWRRMQDYSINWITSLLSFIGDELGEEGVERALRRTGDEFIRPRRDTGVEWSTLPAEARAKVIARAMVANFGTCEVQEDDDKITLRFRCGTGGRLIDEGRYRASEGGVDDGSEGYLVLREAGPRTFGRDELPVYCAHCSVNNEIQPVEWGGVPTSVEHPPTAPGEPCVHEIWRDPTDAPAETWVRIGFPPDIMDTEPATGEGGTR
jgi:hypothetical protein